MSQFQSPAIPLASAPFARSFGPLRPLPAITVAPGLEIALVRADGPASSAFDAGPEVTFFRDAPQSVTIEESGGGSVPVLKARNHTDAGVFVMAGQLIRGGKQNRGINADALVPARDAIDLPVTCVEQGRWSNVPREGFRPAGFEPSYLRSDKMRAVHASKRAVPAASMASIEACFRADQSAVWDAIAELQGALGCRNGSGDLVDSLSGLDRAADAADPGALRSAWDGASGMLVFLEGEFIGGDVLGCPGWFASAREDLLASALASHAMARRRHGRRDWLDEERDFEEWQRARDAGPEALEAILHRRAERDRMRRDRGPAHRGRPRGSVDHAVRAVLRDALNGTWLVQRGVGSERAWQLEHPFLEAAACVSPGGRPLHLLLGTVRPASVFVN